MEFTEEYPNKAPTVKFKSKLFHPNGKLLALRASARLVYGRMFRFSGSSPVALLVRSVRVGKHLLGHPPKPVEPDLRRSGDPYIHPGTLLYMRCGDKQYGLLIKQVYTTRVWPSFCPTVFAERPEPQLSCQRRSCKIVQRKPVRDLSSCA